MRYCDSSAASGRLNQRLLSTRRLRFSRLDSVDDITEAQTHAGIEFGKYFFVSCWTQEEDDNLAQWKMYGGNMEGIRIEFPIYPFKNVRMESHGESKVTGDLYSPLSTNELYGHDYMIIPPFLGSKTFAGAVEYVDDVTARYASAISHTKDRDGRDQIQIDKFFDLPRLKSKIWKFQSEYRFLLYVMPIDPPFPKGIPISPTVDQLVNCSQAFIRGVDPGVSFIDVPINPVALNQMIIRMGPLCTPGGKVCVEALRDSFAPKAKIELSPLAGTVRRKP